MVELSNTYTCFLEPSRTQPHLILNYNMNVLCVSVLCCVRAMCLSSCENRPQHTAQEPQTQKSRIAQKLFIPATKKLISNSTKQFQQEPKSFEFISERLVSIVQVIVFPSLDNRGCGRWHTHRNISGFRKVFRAIEMQTCLRAIVLSRINQDRERKNLRCFECLHFCIGCHNHCWVSGPFPFHLSSNSSCSACALKLPNQPRTHSLLWQLWSGCPHCLCFNKSTKSSFSRGWVFFFCKGCVFFFCIFCKFFFSSFFFFCYVFFWERGRLVFFVFQRGLLFFQRGLFLFFKGVCFYFSKSFNSFKGVFFFEEFFFFNVVFFFFFFPLGLGFIFLKRFCLFNRRGLDFSRDYFFMCFF